MPTNETLLAALRERGERTTPSKAAPATLILTGLLFLAAGGLHWGWGAVAQLMVAVGLHELGHVLAMRLLGYRNVRVLFLPLFGALAAGEPRELDATRNALVALAGPVFGLLTAAGAALGAALTGQPWLVHFAWISLLINGFNLLPLVPLDGGRVTNEALFARFPKVEVVFRGLAIAVLGYFAWRMQSWLLAVLPLGLVLTLAPGFLRSEKIADLRREAALRQTDLDLEGVHLLRRAALELNVQLEKEAFAPQLVEHMHGLWLGVKKRFPGPGTTALLVLAYLGTLLLLLPFVAGFIAAIGRGLEAG